METKFKRKICIDFDGVIHSYTTKWDGADHIPDPPVKGAIAWLKELIKSKDIEPMIYSSRSITFEGINAMKEWLIMNGLSFEEIQEIRFPMQKPAAFLTIDDRAICFQGIFPTIQEMCDFRPWNKR